jgi:hypothetical protein
MPRRRFPVAIGGSSASGTNNEGPGNQPERRLYLHTRWRVAGVTVLVQARRQGPLDQEQDVAVEVNPGDLLPRDTSYCV